MAGHLLWYAKNWQNRMPIKTISKPIVESNRKLITYQVHGSPWNNGAKYTLVKWMIIAPIPCFDVSYHHVSHDRRTLGGSRNRFAEIEINGNRKYIFVPTDKKYQSHNDRNLNVWNVVNEKKKNAEKIARENFFSTAYRSNRWKLNRLRDLAIAIQWIQLMHLCCSDLVHCSQYSPFGELYYVHVGCVRACMRIWCVISEWNEWMNE